MIRQLIREMLLAEQVYGAQAVVYHGSKAPPDVFIPALLNDTFEPGRGDGAMYGKALYCVYDLEGTKTAGGAYGSYIYKFKVNLYGFICFEPGVARLVYGRPLTPVEQAQEIGLDEMLIEKLQKIPTSGYIHSSDAALPASKFLKGHVRGLIFTGQRDGRVAVIYDQTIAVPFAWKRLYDKSWTSIDRDPLRLSYKKSAEKYRDDGIDWKPEKYEVDYNFLFAKLGKLPPDKRTIKGNINLFAGVIESLPDSLHVDGDLILSHSRIASLPSDLKVGGKLRLDFTYFTSLPDGLQVGGDLNLWRSKITSLPADLQVGGDIKGFEGDKSQVPPHLKDKIK